MGFILNDKNLKRAGMDYWHDLDVTVYDSIKDFVKLNMDQVDFPEEMLNLILDGSDFSGTDDVGRVPQKASGVPGAGRARLWFATTKALKVHSEAEFQDGDYIMFGKESAGIPEEILMTDKDHCIRIPMAKDQRSLNLSNSAAIVLYEALRQNDYLSLETEGQLHRHSWS